MFSFNQLATAAVSKRASDLHLTVGLPPVCRIDGTLLAIHETPLKSGDILAMIKEILPPQSFALLEQNGELDYACGVPGVARFRLNIFSQRGSYALVARALNTTIPTPAQLKLPPSIISVCEKKRGLVLVTGATGSGKSTTLASLINEINIHQGKHIITLEDPIEYLHSHKKSVVNQREVGSDTKGFPPALRAALRQDPDVILVGEMRDLETIQIAITAAETGHLVLSTLHTVGAANTIDRIIDVFPPQHQQQIRTQLADVLECVVSQQLIPKAGGSGRVGAFEVMLTNSAIRNNIREGKTFQIPSIIMTNAKLGMKTMDEALYELHRNGEITREDALRYAQDEPALSKRIF